MRVLAAMVMAAALTTQMAEAKLLKLPYKESKLPNGLRVFLVKYPSPGVVAYQIPVHAGSRNEVEQGKTGFAHFFEHLMFRGTKKRSSKEFGDLYVRLGCENNAWTSTDMTCYHGVVASVYLPKILEAEADRFSGLSFDEKALRDEAGAVLGEYNKDVASPEFMLEEKLMSTAFAKHPYAHTTMGYKEDVVRFTERYKDVWPFFKRYYRPSNVSVVLVGDIDFDQSLKWIKKYFGTWKDVAFEPVEIPQEPEQAASREATVRLGKPTQTRLTVAYKVPAFSTKNEEAAALELLGEYLFSVTSDFQKEYRYGKKWLDSVSGSAVESLDPGLWTISLRLSAEGEGHAKEVLAAVEKTIAATRDQGVEAKRLSDVKKRFQNAVMTSWFQSPEVLAGRVAWYTNFESDLGVLDRYFNQVSNTSAEQIQAFAKRHLVDAHKTTITLKE